MSEVLFISQLPRTFELADKPFCFKTLFLSCLSFFATLANSVLDKPFSLDLELEGSEFVLGVFSETEIVDFSLLVTFLFKGELDQS